MKPINVDYKDKKLFAIKEAIKKQITKNLKLNEVSQLSWLERYTDNVEVGSSSLPETTN